MVTLGYGNPLNVIIYDLGGRLMAFDEKCLYSVQSSYNTCTCSFAKSRIVCLGKFSSLSLTYLRRMFCSLSFMCKWQACQCTGHMVQNPSCWMPKECNSLQNKATSTSQASRPWDWKGLDIPIQAVRIVDNLYTSNGHRHLSAWI